MPMSKPLWQMGVQFFQIGRRWRRLVDKELVEFGLTEATWRPLFYLGQLGEGVRQNELADAIEIRGPSLVRLIDNLVAEGMVIRREDSLDRRGRLIYMTDAGRAVQHKVVAATSRVSKRLLGSHDPAELDQVSEFLDRLSASLALAETSDDR